MQLQRKGFTFMELLIVISIIGILASLIMFTFRGAQMSSRDGKRKSDLSSYRGAMELYAASNAGAYPGLVSISDINALCAVLVPSYVGSCTKDPLSPKSEYYYQATTGGQDYCMWTNLERNANCFRVCSDGKALEYAAVSGACVPVAIP